LHHIATDRTVRSNLVGEKGLQRKIGIFTPELKLPDQEIGSFLGYETCYLGLVRAQ